MLIPTPCYANCGRRAAQALNESNGFQYRHQRDWYQHSIAQEPTRPERDAASAAYKEGFSEARRVPDLVSFD